MLCCFPLTWSHAFSRAWRRLHGSASSSDWFIELSASLVIEQTYYFSFSFTTCKLIIITLTYYFIQDDGKEKKIHLKKETQG